MNNKLTPFAPPSSAQNCKVSIIKCLIINIILLLFVCFLAELGAIIIKASVNVKEKYSDGSLIHHLDYIKEYVFWVYKNYKKLPWELNNIRPVESKDNDKGQIILLGCSYTYGHGLQNDETFSYLLSKLSDRTIYNFGISSTSPKDSLYMLRDDNFLSEYIKKTDNIEFVIYTFIDDHIFRLFYNLSEFSPIAKIKNNKIVFKDKTLFNATFFSREIDKLIYNSFTSEEEKKYRFILYIKEINEEIKKKFSFNNQPSKFIILGYDELPFNELKHIDDNIKVINIKDITDTDYIGPEYVISSEDRHPNKKAWELIVPNLIRTLNID